MKHRKLYKDAYILRESFAMTDKSYPPPCRNYLQPLYLSVTLYACAQRDNATAITTDSANQRPNTTCIRLWIDVTFRVLEFFLYNIKQDGGVARKSFELFFRETRPFVVHAVSTYDLRMLLRSLATTENSVQSADNNEMCRPLSFSILSFPLLYIYICYNLLWR